MKVLHIGIGEIYQSFNQTEREAPYRLWMSHELRAVVALIDMSPELIDMSRERGI